MLASLTQILLLVVKMRWRMHGMQLSGYVLGAPHNRPCTEHSWGPSSAVTQRQATPSLPSFSKDAIWGLALSRYLPVYICLHLSIYLFLLVNPSIYQTSSSFNLLFMALCIGLSLGPVYLSLSVLRQPVSSTYLCPLPLSLSYRFQ